MSLEENQIDEEFRKLRSDAKEAEKIRLLSQSWEEKEKALAQELAAKRRLRRLKMDRRVEGLKTQDRRISTMEDEHGEGY